MPNIEIHGYPDIKQVPVQKLVDRIWELLGAVDYVDDVVVSRIPSRVQDARGASQPFLRLVAPKASKHELNDIESRLRHLSLDIEVMFLERFVPKKT